MASTHQQVSVKTLALRTASDAGSVRGRGCPEFLYSIAGRRGSYNNARDECKRETG